MSSRKRWKNPRKRVRPNRQKNGRPYYTYADGYSRPFYVRGRWGKKHRSRLLATAERRSLNKHTRQALEAELREEADWFNVDK